MSRLIPIFILLALPACNQVRPGTAEDLLGDWYTDCYTEDFDETACAEQYDIVHRVTYDEARTTAPRLHLTAENYNGNTRSNEQPLPGCI